MKSSSERPNVGPVAEDRLREAIWMLLEAINERQYSGHGCGGELKSVTDKQNGPAD